MLLLAGPPSDLVASRIWDKRNWEGTMYSFRLPLVVRGRLSAPLIRPSSVSAACASSRPPARLRFRALASHCVHPEARLLSEGRLWGEAPDRRSVVAGSGPLERPPVERLEDVVVVAEERKIVRKLLIGPLA